MSAHDDGVTYAPEIGREVIDVDLPETCDDCGDELIDGEGCRHEGDYCGSCFATHCRECVDQMADDMRAEALMDRDR